MCSYFIELCLFGAHARSGTRSKWSLWSLAENLKGEGSSTSDSKMDIFHGFLTFIDGEYTCEM